MAGVHLTRIYTKTGDAGSTAIGDGSRVAKTDPRVIATADVDECNAALGVALAVGQLPEDLRTILVRLQNDLFDVGADLCNPLVPEPRYQPLRITEADVTRVEEWCDEINSGLPTLTSFVLPSGTPGSAHLHLARTIARRAERSAWELVATDADRVNPTVLVYLNRLSDLLFVMARAANPGGDVTWVPAGSR